MRVLLLGATGNLGSRLIPALLAHDHKVVVYVRSVDRLRASMTSALLDRVVVYEGDGLDSNAIEDSLRKHDCEGVVNAAHNFSGRFRKQSPGSIAAAVARAAISVGKASGRPLRIWQIGGLGSLEYPGTGGYKIQDYMPSFMTEHHQAAERLFKQIPLTDLKWSLLCVAFMYPASEEIIELRERQHHGLVVAASKPPVWNDHWTRSVPVVGEYLNLVPAIRSYSTSLDEVADLIAELLEDRSQERFVGDFVGVKQKYKA